MAAAPVVVAAALGVMPQASLAETDMAAQEEVEAATLAPVPAASLEAPVALLVARFTHLVPWAATGVVALVVAVEAAGVPAQQPLELQAQQEPMDQRQAVVAAALAEPQVLAEQLLPA